MSDDRPRAMPSAAALAAAALTLIYTVVSLAGLGMVFRQSGSYPPLSIATDVIFTTLAIVLVTGLLRRRTWAWLILFGATMARLAKRLWSLGITVYRVGPQDVPLPEPLWLVQVLLLLAIAVCLVLPQTRQDAAPASL